MKDTMLSPAIADKIRNGIPLPEKQINTGKGLDIMTQIERQTPSMGVILNVLVTPQMAEEMLKHNIGNRPQSQTEIEYMASVMDAGKWVFNGDIIRFSQALKLVDGQHKLEAVILSGKPQRFHIQCGLSDEAFATIDTGRKRTAGDTLAVHGVANPNVAAAAIKAYIYFVTKQSVGGRISGRRVSNQTVEEWIANNQIKAVSAAVQKAVNEYSKDNKNITQTNWAFLHYIFSKKNKAEAEFFLEKLATGEDISRNKYGPIWLLREKLQQLRTMEAARMAEMRMKYIMTAWNHYRRNEKVTSLLIDKKSNIIPKPI